VITSIRPTEELNLKIHNFLKSREYKALKSFCLDIGRHFIDTHGQAGVGEARKVFAGTREADEFVLIPHKQHKAREVWSTLSI
jgi:hypothetical protein